jgi:hypothetical protein
MAVDAPATGRVFSAVHGCKSIRNKQCPGILSVERFVHSPMMMISLSSRFEDSVLMLAGQDR